MANCTLCGKSIGVLSSGVISLPRDNNNEATYIKVCGECEKKFAQVMDSKEDNYDENKNEMLRAMTNAESSVKRRIESLMFEKQEGLKKAKIEKTNQIALEGKKILEQERILITTGYSFEGYKIVKYLNIVNGEIVLGTGFLSELSASVNDMLGTSSGTIGGKLSKAKQVVQSHMIEKAIGRGANALIGVDFDINVLGNNMLIVSANGTAVVIEKIDK
ncbi:YbjQ family protein [Faecalicatena contorta]|uniref:YbjQ family protein n=1 Tax=Faecalicatena contorta TaxID=39482 RepID=UPI001F3E6C85|nr:YbjQ family protein [Faecalicatena contorta]MCF2554415.1 YbjQ family protein [Faecalicatena contorta]